MSYFVKSNYIFDVNTRNTFSGYIEIEKGIIKNVIRGEFSAENKEVIDYSNFMIVPGFIDAHVHFYLASLINTGKICFIDGKSAKEVAKKAKKLPIYKGWKIGIGWYASDFGQQVYPGKKDLDEYIPDVPVMLISGDAHTVWFNSKALEMLNIDEKTVLTNVSGEILRDKEKITGVFLEAIAIYYLAKVLEIYKEDFPTASKEYMKNLNAMGITAVGDVALSGESPDDLVYHNLYSKISNPTVKITFFPAMRENVTKLKEIYKKYQSDMLNMGGVKQFFDGVTSSHTAYLKNEYTKPYFKGDVGIPLLPIEKMKNLINLANKNNLPIRIHAIGDKAIELTLRYLKNAQENYPLSANKYNTIEHLEVMDLADLDLTTQENLVVSVQPSHLLVGYETLDEEVGELRAKTMFPFNSFVKEGAELAFGTDVPVVLDVSPIDTIYYAVNRQTKDGKPKEALIPNEKMTVQDSLYAHTKGAATALSRDDIGGIEIGKKADFVVLDKNLLKETNLLDVNVIATFVNGKKVYNNNKNY